MKYYIGVDIGGTKCAVVLGDTTGNIVKKFKFPTTNLTETLNQIFTYTAELWTDGIEAIGISCGGPLDSKKGVILGPPNLPGWDEVPITELLTERFGVPAYLKNDADACAVAEWQFGAGRGSDNVIFLTFGTGIGAGLILNGKLYEGACGMAGEVGHVRLFKTGNTGYGKQGSYEGYCSGGGIAQYGCGTAEELAVRAARGDAEALRMWDRIGRNLGSLLSILIDILNPDVIVIGSIYVRAGHFMKDGMMQVLEQETLAPNRNACRIMPAKLGESLGDIAALSVAITSSGAS